MTKIDDCSVGHCLLLRDDNIGVQKYNNARGRAGRVRHNATLVLLLA